METIRIIPTCHGCGSIFEKGRHQIWRKGKWYCRDCSHAIEHGHMVVRQLSRFTLKLGEGVAGDGCPLCRAGVPSLRGNFLQPILQLTKSC